MTRLPCVLVPLRGWLDAAQPKRWCNQHRRHMRGLLSYEIRSFSSSSSSLTWWNRMVKAFRTGNLNDDQSNPKKRLERHSYLYYALLALQYRTIRLDPQSGTAGTVTTSAKTTHDTDAHYDQATDVLDTMGLDQMTNVALRQQMQSMLQPQVQTVLAAFDKVDARLGVTWISPSSASTSTIPPKSRSPLDNSNDMGESTPIPQFVLPKQCRLILSAEWDRTCQQLSEGTSLSTSSVNYLQTKREAIALLATFYGWSLPNHDTAADDSQTNSRVDAFGMPRSNPDDSNVPLIRYHQTLNMCRSALLRAEIGYSVLVLRSNVDTLGRGVFLDGSALAGSIMAFQPGDVWPKEHLLNSSPDIMDHFDDTYDDDVDCRVSLRFDDYVIDARRSPVTVLTQEGSVNPWALGHMVNHPNFPVQQPNALSIMLNFTETMKLAQLVRYIPNTYARVPSWQSVFFDPDVIMHGLCLLARRDVCDEELLYDYRLQTDEPPDWYSVVRYEDGFEEDQVVFFREPEHNPNQTKQQ